MSRSARGHSESGIYHVLNRGNHREPIFDDPFDYLDLLEIMLAIKTNFPFLLHAFCLMPNHFHLLIQKLTIPISAIMQKIQGTYAMRINRRRNQTGHVFQDRFRDVPCQSDAQYKAVLRYIHQNPLRAGLVKCPEYWDWSSHNAYVNDSGPNFGIVDVGIGLKILGRTETVGRNNYRKLMGVELSREDLDSIRSSINGVRENLPPVKGIETEKGKTSLSSIVRAYCNATGITIEELTGSSRARILTPLRRKLIKSALKEGFSIREIGRCLNRSTGAVSRLIY